MWRSGAVITALFLAALPACSDDGGGDGPSASETTIDPGDQETVDIAQAWVDDTAELDDAVRSSLRFETITTTPAVANVTFGQYYDDHPVQGAALVVHVLENGEVQGATDALVDAQPPEEGGDGTITQDEAEETAGKAVDGLPDEVGPSELVWVPSGDELALSWLVALTATDPVAAWEVVVDAATGAVTDLTQVGSNERGVAAPVAPWDRRPSRSVAVRQAADDACDPGPAPSACLFIPDPVYASGGERPDAAAANEALEGRPLENLDDDSGHLIGRFVNTEPADSDARAPVEEDGTWAAGRARPGIEHAMAYFWIDRAHAELERLGFGDLRNAPIDVEAIDADPENIDNAYWTSAPDGIHLGAGSDGINEGEDASGIIHEYGHAVLAEQVPSMFNSPEGGAYHEAFGDLLAYFVTLDDRTGDQACMFAWTDPQSRCIRRLDDNLVYPDDLQNEVHASAPLYAGAIFDVFSTLLAEEGIDVEDCPGSNVCDETSDRVLTTLMTAHGFVAGDDITFPDLAAAFISANDAAFDGADADLITSVFAEHGLADGGSGVIDGNGGVPRPATSTTSVEFDIDHSFRGDLAVEVGVVDAAGDELCTPVTLHEPDLSDAGEDLSGVTDVGDSDCAGLVPPSADQRWYLKAVDTAAQDEGRIVAFSVVDGDNPYVAGGLPQPIADNDPTGTTVFIDGTGEDGNDTELPDDVTCDGPTMTLAITHSYVGDLSIGAGVASADGDLLCSVPVLDPDESERGDGGIEGSVDLSDCADQYPPSPDALWFLDVTDTAAEDVGTLDSVSLTGPDGEVIDFEGLPAEIPDADTDGLVVFTDGSTTESDTTVGGDAPSLQVDIDHPYAGDLSVEVGAVDADSNVLCQVQVATPDQSNSEPGLQIEESLDECAASFPPDAGTRFYLLVVDTLAEDTGHLNGATLEGSDGERLVATPDGDGEIPDADPDGLLVLFEPA